MRLTFTSDSSTAIKCIWDLGPKFQAEEMEVVRKVNEEALEEKMDHNYQQNEERVAMDAEELEEGKVVGEDDKEELQEGQIIDSDTDLGGEVTK